MLSFRTQNRLAALLQSIAEGEKKTEVVRQVLAEQKLFEPHTAFRRLDSSRDGYISSSELMDFLVENNVAASSRECLHLFNQLDFNDDGLIAYNDFVSTILPQEDHKLRTLATLRESYFLEVGEPLPYEVEWALARVFESEIKNFRTIENLRSILQSSYDYNPLDCFNTVDEEKLGYIDAESINLFMRSCNRVLSEDEIHALIRAVGSADIGRITYTQFSSVISTDRPVANRFGSRHTSAEKIFSTPKRVDQSLYADYLKRSIERERIQQSVERELKLKEIETRSAERRRLQLLGEREFELKQLERSIKLKELETSLEVEEQLRKTMVEEIKLKQLQQSIERENRLKDVNRQIERESRLAHLQRSIEREHQVRELSRSIEREKRIHELERSIEKSRIQQHTYNTPSRTANNFYESPKSVAYQSASKSGFKSGLKSAVKSSPMKGREEEHLVRALKQQVNMDREIEDIKKQLSLKSDFNLLDAFRVFDLKGRGYITKLEMEVALQENGIYPTKDETYLFFKRYDKDSDGLLRYSEFCKAVLPQTTEYATMMNNRQCHYVESQEGLSCFEYETRFGFKKLLQKLMQAEVEAEALRQSLTRRPLFSLHDAFTAIDTDDNGFITIEEFKGILNEHGFFVSNHDLIALINRYDRNQDGKVSYGEFLSEMTPKSPQRY